MTIIEGASPREAELEEQNSALEDTISELRRQNDALSATLRQAEEALRDTDAALTTLERNVGQAIRRIA